MALSVVCSLLPFPFDLNLLAGVCSVPLPAHCHGRFVARNKYTLLSHVFPMSRNLRIFGLAPSS